MEAITTQKDKEKLENQGQDIASDTSQEIKQESIEETIEGLVS